MAVKNRQPCMNDLVEFVWHRLTNPAWKEERHFAGEPDEINTSILVGEEGAAYRPLSEHPALFMEFAGLDGSEPSFLKFAEEHGRLGLYRHHESQLESWVGGSPLCDEEEYCYWRGEHEMMKAAVALHRATDREDATDGDEQFVKLTAKPGAIEAAVFLGHRSRPLTTIRSEGRSKRLALRRLLAAYVSEGLVKREVSPSLTLAETGLRPMRLTYQAQTLIAAMWLQLALAIDGHRLYQTCEVCGKPWDATNSRAGYCSEACRQRRAYLKRKGEWPQEQAVDTTGGAR